MQMREVGDYDDDIKEVNGTGFLQNSWSIAFGCKKQEDQEYLRREWMAMLLTQDLALRTQADSWDCPEGSWGSGTQEEIQGWIIINGNLILLKGTV